jgi:hypothetical protein
VRAHERGARLDRARRDRVARARVDLDRANETEAHVKLRRRSFLGAAGIGAATLLLPRKSRAADVFGEFPSSASSLLLPENLRAKNVLEIYLYGGLSPWETLYHVPQFGRATDTFYWAFRGNVGSFDSNEQALAACEASGADVEASYFADDALGTQVMLGPYAFALRERPDFVERMRIIAMKHDLLPHEAAVPFAVSGKRVGQPSLASLGAHIQRYYNERSGAGRQTPFSYVLANGAAIPSDNTAALFATGTHPGTARPLRINVDVIAQLSALLERNGVLGGATGRERHDALVSAYVDRYRARLRHGAHGADLRSKRFAELDAAARATANSAAVKDILAPTLHELPFDDLCQSGSQANVPERSLEIAAHLLTHPTEPARYVCVVDTGLIPADGGGGYDTHAIQCLPTLTNFTNIFRSLAAVTNAPGESDPAKLNLDDTIVLINTEFGRTPDVQDGAGGRNHHPFGYTTAVLGGPITSPSIVGAINDRGDASRFSVPAESRMAALLALGIYPFAGDSFFVSDVPDGATEEGVVERVTRSFLGQGDS